MLKAQAVVKLSILAFYHEHLGGKRSRVIVISLLAGVVFAQWMSFTIFNLLVCKPLRDSWDLHPGPRDCVNAIPSFVANGTLDAVTTAVILCLPIFYVEVVRLRPAAKISTVVIALLSVLLVSSLFLH